MFTVILTFTITGCKKSNEFDVKKTLKIENIESVEVSIGVETDYASPPSTTEVEKEKWQSVIDKLESYGFTDEREDEGILGWDIAFKFKMKDQKTYSISILHDYASVSVHTGDVLKDGDYKLISDYDYTVSGFDLDDFKNFFVK